MAINGMTYGDNDYTEDPFIPDAEHFDLRRYASQFYTWILLQDSARKLSGSEKEAVYAVVFDDKYPMAAGFRRQLLDAIDGPAYAPGQHSIELNSLLDQFEDAKRTHPFLDKIVRLSHENATRGEGQDEVRGVSAEVRQLREMEWLLNSMGRG